MARDRRSLEGFRQCLESTSKGGRGSERRSYRRSRAWRPGLSVSAECTRVRLAKRARRGRERRRARVRAG